MNKLVDCAQLQNSTKEFWCLLLQFSFPEHKHHSNKPPHSYSECSRPYCHKNHKTPPIHHITPVLKKLHWIKIPERIEYNAISLTYITYQSSQPSYLRQLFTIQHSRSMRSSTTLTLLRPSVTSSLNFADRSIAIAVPPLWKNSHQQCDKYLTHSTNLPKPHLLLSLHSSFTPN